MESTRSAKGPQDAPRRSPLLWLGVGAAVTAGAAWALLRRPRTETTLLNTLADTVRSLDEPAWPQLLPPRAEEPPGAHPRPYTLVVDLDRFLVCHVWDAAQGRWRVAKRPGADVFLFYAAQLYEVVVFSSLPQHEGDAIVRKLDPYGCVSYALYRFATRRGPGGALVKDVGMLGRDLSKVLVLGHDTAGFAPQAANVLPMAPWDGRADDRALEDAVDFLEMLAFSRLPDVRPAIARYAPPQGAADATALFPASFDRAQAAVRPSGSAQRMLGAALALGSRRPESPGDYWARKDERVALRRKEYARVRETMQAQLDKERAREQAYHAEHRVSLWDLFTRGSPPARAD